MSHTKAREIPLTITVEIVEYKHRNAVFSAITLSWFLSFFTHMPFVSKYIFFYIVLQVNSSSKAGKSAGEKNETFNCIEEHYLYLKATKHRSNWLTKCVVFGVSI